MENEYHWFMSEGKPKLINNAIMPDMNFTPFKGMWHVNERTNCGNPYTGFMRIIKVYDSDDFSAVINSNRIFSGMGGRFVEWV